VPEVISGAVGCQSNSSAAIVGAPPPERYRYAIASWGLTACL
jgi:hypothetical protein